MADEKARYLMWSDAGYGFVAPYGELLSKNRAGKAVLTVPNGGVVMPPVRVDQAEDLYLVSATNEGRMLIFPIRDLPEMARGKGNKIISIPSARCQAREEMMVAAAVFTEKDTLIVHSGKRHLKLRFSDLEHYLGERGRRGHKLPRGLQRVDAIEVLRVDGDAGLEPLPIEGDSNE